MVPDDELCSSRPAVSGVEHRARPLAGATQQAESSAGNPRPRGRLRSAEKSTQRGQESQGESCPWGSVWVKSGWAGLGQMVSHVLTLLSG